MAEKERAEREAEERKAAERAGGKRKKEQAAIMARLATVGGGKPKFATTTGISALLDDTNPDVTMSGVCVCACASALSGVYVCRGITIIRVCVVCLFGGMQRFEASLRKQSLVPVTLLIARRRRPNTVMGTTALTTLHPAHNLPQLSRRGLHFQTLCQPV